MSEGETIGQSPQVLPNGNWMQELQLSLFRHEQSSDRLTHLLLSSVSLLRANKGNIQLYDPRRGGLRIVTQIGFDKAFVEFFDSVQEGHAACGTALARKQRVVVEDVFTDPIFEHLRPICKKYDYAAVQSTPLRGEHGKVVGVLSTHFRRRHRPSDRELELLDALLKAAEPLLPSFPAEVRS